MPASARPLVAAARRSSLAFLIFPELFERGCRLAPGTDGPRSLGEGRGSERGPSLCFWVTRQCRAFLKGMHTQVLKRNPNFALALSMVLLPFVFVALASYNLLHAPLPLPSPAEVPICSRKDLVLHLPIPAPALKLCWLLLPSCTGRRRICGPRCGSAALHLFGCLQHALQRHWGFLGHKQLSSSDLARGSRQ